MTAEADPAAQRLARRFDRQARAVVQQGSPLYVALLDRVARDLLSGGPTLALLRSRAGERGGQALPLRLMASAHRMALTGAAPRLAAHLPSTGGDGSADGAWAALRELVATRPDELDALLDRPLQTNEPGRCAALVTGFAAVAGATGLPLRVLELGTSAGLNLNWHRFRFDSSAGTIGDPRSPVALECAPWPGPRPAVRVATARGCDAHPLDPSSPDDELTLRSAVWADQPQRLALLDAALAVARRHPPTVDRADALEWLEATPPCPGVATVVVHSVVEQYLDDAARRRLAEVMGDRVVAAPADAPVAWLSLERPTGEGAYGLAELRLALSPDPQRRLLGHAGYHGSPVAPATERRPVG